MARNEEKANSLLNRWQALKSEVRFGTERARRRPFLASECNSLPQAEKWRHEIIREITQLVTKIQNASLGEHVIRDLNDEINKKMREKHHWERQIQALGGPNYAARSASAAEMDGKTLPGTRGYRYFGAAKNLQGVRELFEQTDVPKQNKRTRADMYRGIGPGYYGFGDEEDGTLVPVEAEAERRAREAAEADYKRRRAQREAEREASGVSAAVAAMVGADEEDEDGLGVDSAAANADLRAHVPVPDQGAIEAALVERKKRELLERYVAAAERAAATTTTTAGVQGQ